MIRQDTFGLLSKKVSTSFLADPFKGPITFAAAFLIFLNVKKGIIPTSQGAIPDLSAFLVYGLLFTYGWGFEGKKTSRDTTYVLLGLLSWVVTMILFLNSDQNASVVIQLAASAFAGVTVWFFVTGFFSLFTSIKNKKILALSRFHRLSYPIYLLHFPFVIWIPILIAEPLQGFLLTKIFITFFASLLFSVFLGKALTPRSGLLSRLS